jgi:hypothetical protein
MGIPHHFSHCHQRERENMINGDGISLFKWVGADEAAAVLKAHYRSR